MIIRTDYNNENLLNDEIEINKEICISKNDYFIKMLSYYEFDKKTYSIVGQKTKKRFTLGDTVTFKVAGVDLDRKTLDYLPA